MKKIPISLQETSILHTDAWFVEIIRREKRAEKVVSQVIKSKKD